jgi:hypothetical protein
VSIDAHICQSLEDALARSYDELADFEENPDIKFKLADDAIPTKYSHLKSMLDNHRKIPNLVSHEICDAFNISRVDPPVKIPKCDQFCGSLVVSRRTTTCPFLNSTRKYNRNQP